MDLGLRDSVCVVTGSTGGIGLETRGCSPPRARGSSTRGRGDAPGDRRALHVAADLSEPDAPERGRRRGGRARSAGSTASSTTSASPIQPLRRADRRGVGRDVAAERDELRARDPGRAAGHARARRGAIVNVSSTAGKRPSTGMPDYSVTKAAMLSLSRLVADLYAEGRDPLQRRHARARPRPTRGSARAASPTSRATATRCSRRSARAGRSAGWPSRRRSPP